MTLHLLQNSLLRQQSECSMVANLAWLVSKGSLIFHHASTANNYNQSQWSCKRLLAVVLRADSDPDSCILHAGSQKKSPKVDRSFRRKEKHGRRNDSFFCVCTPPFMLTGILYKIYSIYFDDYWVYIYRC